MKHFIYMNTEIINSYISQIESGLTVGNHQEVTDTTTEVQGKSRTEPQQQVEGKGTLGFVGITAKLNSEINTQSSTLTQVEAGRELIDKILHDDSFNKFYKYIRDEGKIKNEKTSNMGDYIEKKENFKFWDLDYLIEAFNEKTVEFIVNSSLEEEVKKLKEQGKTVKNFEMKNMAKTIKEPIVSGMEIIRICREILPCSKFITTNNMIVPINEKFLREEIKSIRFKYDCKLDLIGRYTGNYLKENTTFEEERGFHEVFKSLDEMSLIFIKDIIGIDINSKIIEPIALYLE